MAKKPPPRGSGSKTPLPPLGAGSYAPPHNRGQERSDVSADTFANGDPVRLGTGVPGERVSPDVTINGRPVLLGEGRTPPAKQTGIPGQAYPIDGTDSAGPPDEPDDAEAFQSDAFDSGTFGGAIGSAPIGATPFGGDLSDGPLNTRPLNAPTASTADNKHAPEPVRTTVGAPVIVHDQREVRATTSKAPVEVHTIAPSPGGRVEVSGEMVRALIADRFRSPSKGIASLQLQSLIAAFREVDEYDPNRHHNSKPQPALWVNDSEYLSDVRALLKELRRLNELLETQKEPDTAKIEKTGGALADAAKIISESAYKTIGTGLGLVILGSVAGILLHMGVPTDVGQIIMSGVKGK